ncbi:hypothetical protein B4589_004025 [Halolamina sp. CBA1230]|uniref:BsuPI-related putative proteinase inhibitor n=1 Tax=Halolamina sp. CBA1230 TaxID=1853690 RepID=UPI001302087C|nr:BsuPI-related putative proteinase inhibitor [Halolamina sp. CBA1230]QKY19585.1 hypothetical protein B4589_004025 [Halolamina sp. CBA1230]
MLETSLRSQRRDGALAFDLTVENRGDDPVELTFPDAQRLRVSLYPADADGEAAPIWRSDADRMFAQVLGSETIPAGESVTFSTAWKEPEPGEYHAVGEMTCQDRDVTAEETVLI